MLTRDARIAGLLSEVMMLLIPTYQSFVKFVVSEGSSSVALLLLPLTL
jgi:hypothetical protein